jgi:hypothetical protein
MIRSREQRRLVATCTVIAALAASALRFSRRRCPEVRHDDE